MLVGLLRLISWLPFPVIYVLGSAVGSLAYVLVKSRRLITLRNLALCLPELSEKERRRIAHRHFRLLVVNVFSIGVIWWGSKKRLTRLIKITGQEHIDPLLEAKQPVILLAPHFTSLEASGMILSKDVPVVSMYQQNKNPVFDHSIIVRRSRFGATMYNRKAPLTSLIRAIRRGLPFYYLPDQNAGTKHGIFVPFFGIPASTFPVLGKIAQTSKASVIPWFSRTLPWGRGWEVIVKPPLTNFPGGDEYQDTLAMNQAVEMGARELQENYLWSHKRFKRRPEGEADLYKNLS